MNLLLQILGTLWAAPHSIIGLLFMLIPYYHGAWFPYFPRAVRRRGFIVQFIAGKLIPEHIGTFTTWAQTHGNFQWYADEEAWDRQWLVAHETRHTYQEWVFGPLYMPLYGLFYLINLFTMDNGKEAYLAIPFERDARRASGEEDE